jgi:hypothetical protein
MARGWAALGREAAHAVRAGASCCQQRRAHRIADPMTAWDLLGLGAISSVGGPSSTNTPAASSSGGPAPLPAACVVCSSRGSTEAAQAAVVRRLQGGALLLCGLPAGALAGAPQGVQQQGTLLGRGEGRSKVCMLGSH